MNVLDAMPYVCKAAADQNGFNKTIYLAYIKTNLEVPLTVGTCKEDFYNISDFFNKIIFKETTPLKYMIYLNLESKNARLHFKEELAFVCSLLLQERDEDDLIWQLGISKEDYRRLIANDVLEVISKRGKKVSRHHIAKFLNIGEDVMYLKYYETNNLLKDVIYEEIPSEI